MGDRSVPEENSQQVFRPGWTGTALTNDFGVWIHVRKIPRPHFRIARKDLHNSADADDVECSLRPDSDSRSNIYGSLWVL